VDLPLELLGTLSCGLQTGAGAVLNSFDVPAGTSIAVFGTGAGSVIRAAESASDQP
jgi:aryl-alcohol dehydrogenase